MIVFFCDPARPDHVDIAKALTECGQEVILAGHVDPAVMSDVRACIAEHQPKVIIVEGRLQDEEEAEKGPERAFFANAESLIHVGAAALEFQARVVLLSTAEVFGQKGGPWIESDEAHAGSILGESVLKGETLLTRMLKDLLIVRTGPRMTRELKARTLRVRAATDEFVSPIWAEDIGMMLHELLEQRKSGLYHFAPDEAPVSRYEYFSALVGLLGRELQGRPGKQIEALARYGATTGLDSAKLAQSLRKKIRQWRAALPEVTGLAPAEQRTVMAGEQEVRRVEKPWGYEIIWAHSERYVGKILFVKAGERLSLQYHEQKDETVYVLSGKMLFEVGPIDGEREDIVMKKGQSYHITPNTVHRMIAIEDTEILEASTPELNDVVRLEDSYGRAGTSEP